MIRVLVANDDGIDSPGLRAMVLGLSKHAEVYVAAPSQQQSAKARALTYGKPLTVEAREVEGAVAAYAVAGTPADCVLWGLTKYQNEFKFDYVFSGINHGINAGGAAFYSGTVAAALEGSIHGVHSIAMSVVGHGASHFDYICSLIPELMEMSNRLPVDTILSVNAPDLPAWKVKGVKLVDIKPGFCNEKFYLKANDDDSYTIKVVFPTFETDDLRSDFGLAAAGYASISPLRASLTDSASLAVMNGMAATGALCIFLNAQGGLMSELGDAAESHVKQLSLLASCAKRLDMPVILADQYGMGDAVSAVTDNLGNYEILEKEGLSVIGSQDFNNLTAMASDKRAVIAGGETHLEVRAMAKSLMQKGFEVTVLEDCCISRNSRDHSVAIDNLRYEGCHIETLESYMLTAVEECNHPAKKRIKEILNREY